MIIIPREFEFEGSGHKGAAFEQKGLEERNLTNLLKVLSDKTTQKSIEALAKIDKTQWKDIALVAVSLRNIVEAGGLNTITQNIKDTIELKIEELFAPMTNEITTAIDVILAPFINDLLMPVINDLASFLGENMVGAGIGGIAGSLLQWLPGGSLWVILGAAMGAIVEETWERIASGELNEPIAGAGATDAGRERQELGQWLAMGGTIEEYYRLHPITTTHTFLPFDRLRDL